MLQTSTHDFPEVTPSDVEDAAQLLEGEAITTPLLTHPWLNEALGAQLYLKPEMLQVGSSFKFRGAYNRLARLNPDERARGVVAWSSGNFALGIAAAAHRLGIAATIVMPGDAPRAKIAATKRLGATVIPYDRFTESREDVAEEFRQRSGAIAVPPNDDRYVIAGYGTAGLELRRQAERAGVALDAVLVCCGGGGLVAGVALAFDGTPTEVYAVEPAGFDDTARSLAAGERLRVDPNARSICDALLAPIPAAMTFPINQKLLAGAVVVSDAEVEHAIAAAYTTLRLVVEPGGAVALAAALNERIAVRGRRIGVILSGGNVDAAMFADILHRHGEASAERFIAGI